MSQPEDNKPVAPTTSRRSFLTKAAGAALATALPVAAQPSSQSAGTPAPATRSRKRPLNVLFFMSDDMRLAHLDKLGLRDNTAVVFVADHGYQLGEKESGPKPARSLKVALASPHHSQTRRTRQRTFLHSDRSIARYLSHRG